MTTPHITFTPCFDKKPNYTFTSEGYLKADGARLARTGIQEYRAYELGLTDRPAMDLVKVYRPPEEVFAPDSLASFNGKPITNDHPKDFVSSENWKGLAVGTIHNPRQNGDYFAADLVITDKTAISDVVSGKTELSNGYSCVYNWTKGVTPDGQTYDATQCQIRGNHVAIVDAARCGPACSIIDSEVPQMTTRKVVVDGIPFDLPEAAAAAVDKLSADRDAALKAKTLAESKTADGVMLNGKVHTAAEVTAIIAAKDSEITTIKKDVMTPEQRDAMVQEWATTLDTGKRLMPTLVTTGKTCDAIRREVITHLHNDNKAVVDASLGGQDIKTADGGAIKTTFNILAASAKQPQARDALSNLQQPGITAPTPTADGGSAPTVDARTAYLLRMQGRG